MKIAVTGFRGIPASWGGVEHHCEQIYSRLAAKGHEIVIYARSGYVTKDVRTYKGMRIVRLPTINTKHAEAFVHTFLALLHIIVKTNPDIVHIHAQGPAMFSWIPRLFRPRMTVFFTCHGRDWERGKWTGWASRIIRLGEICSTVFPHYRIMVSKELQTYYRNRYGAESFYIPNGVRAPTNRAPEIIRKYGLAARDYFLFVGRIVPEKRLEDTIRAYLSKKRNSKLVVVGEIADTQNYRESLDKVAGSNPDICFVGYQYAEALEEFFSNARAFVNASELEGLPLTVLEALSYGVPCIISDIAPHREIAEHANGLLYTTGEVDALSRRMDEIEAMDESELQACARKTVSAVQEHYNWDAAAQKLERLYRESLGGSAT